MHPNETPIATLQEVEKLEKEYYDGLKAGALFETLRKIRKKIKQLKEGSTNSN